MEGECCGEYCSNCVWLQYIEELFVWIILDLNLNLNLNSSSPHLLRHRSRFLSLFQDHLGTKVDTLDLDELVGTFDADEGVKAYVLFEARLKKEKQRTPSTSSTRDHAF